MGFIHNLGLSQLERRTMNIFQKLGFAVLSLFISKEMSAQMFVESTEDDNPFSSFGFTSESHPAVADLDSDGDLDVIVGSCDGYSSWLTVFENDGSNNFTQTFGAANPFEGIDPCGHPTFVDIDNDSDLDLVVGAYDVDDKYAGLKLFENDGANNFTLADTNPFEGIIGTETANPSFTDFDEDGDMDLLFSDYYYTNLFLNQDNNFVLAGLDTTDFASFQYSIDLTHTFADLDGDGDEDAIFGDKYGELKFYEKNGPGDYTEILGDDNPLVNITSLSRISPEFFDFDGDEDLDLITGQSTGELRLFLWEEEDPPVGFDDVLGDQLVVYPNPANDEIQIKGIKPGWYANIFSVDGQLVLTKPFFHEKDYIDLSTIDSGNYLMVINTDNRSYRKKIVKL